MPWKKTARGGREFASPPPGNWVPRGSTLPPDTEKMVMATPLGENALLVALETYLAESPQPEDCGFKYVSIDDFTKVVWKSMKNHIKSAWLTFCIDVGKAIWEACGLPCVAMHFFEDAKATNQFLQLRPKYILHIMNVIVVLSPLI